jgi:hypothetical protein
MWKPESSYPWVRHRHSPSDDQETVPARPGGATGKFPSAAAVQYPEHAAIPSPDRQPFLIRRPGNGSENHLFQTRGVAAAGNIHDLGRAVGVIEEQASVRGQLNSEALFLGRTEHLFAGLHVPKAEKNRPAAMGMHA